MTILQGPLNILLPEIYPIIAVHLPLYATSSTLLALALTNHHISEIVLPLLYSRLVLKNETDAILVLQKLADDPTLGRIVRELHIMSDLSADTRNQDPPLDVIRRVEDVISKGYLPFIHTLGLHIMKGWYYVETENGYERVRGFGQIRKEFLEQLKENCPRLRGLILNGFWDCPDGSWLEESGGFQDITSLAIRFRRTPGLTRKLPNDKLLRHVLSLAPSLHTLGLNLPAFSDLTSASPIFKIDLPFLRSLSLASFDEVDTKLVMGFFERHPSIEYLDLGVNSRWFVSEPPQNFLPNLLYLRAHWSEVRLLAPILYRLLSLCIHDSLDAQIPYLLRFILPNGLPNLRSLDIGHVALPSRYYNNIEGSLWYESKDGTFHPAKMKEESRTIFDSFMHSIVRATPNLEELGFHNGFLPLSKFVSIADDLNSFPHLKHLYYRGYEEELGTEEEQNTFVSHARDLAEVVPGLMSITNIANQYLPYLTAKIRRKESGEVTDIEVGKGYGMKIGHDDEAFPCAMRK